MCVTGESVQVRARQLYSAYKTWAEQGGEQPVTGTKFGERIAEKYQRQQDARGRIYIGIELVGSAMEGL